MNCKPGDLAYIVAGLVDPSPNIGKVVEVIGLYGIDSALGLMWRCRATSPILTRRRDGRITADLKFASPDAWLRPISGVPVTDDVTEDLKEPA